MHYAPHGNFPAVVPIPASHFLGICFFRKPNLPSDPLGLIRLADDECLCPEGSGRSFVDKLLLAAAADHSMPQQPNKQAHTSDGVANSNGDGGDGGRGRRKEKGQNPGTFRAENEEGRSRGNAAGSSSGGWPAYADLANSESRSPQQCFFQIRHFVGECDRDISFYSLFFLRRQTQK